MNLFDLTDVQGHQKGNGTVKEVAAPTVTVVMPGETAEGKKIHGCLKLNKAAREATGLEGKEVAIVPKAQDGASYLIVVNDHIRQYMAGKSKDVNTQGRINATNMANDLATAWNVDENVESFEMNIETTPVQQHNTDCYKLTLRGYENTAGDLDVEQNSPEIEEGPQGDPEFETAEEVQF